MSMDANQLALKYQLRDELARLCLPAAHRDPNRKLAWINSTCLLFLLIGTLGAKPTPVSIRPVPPLEQAVPVVVEPPPPPPRVITPENQPQDQNDQEQPDSPQVVVVTPESPTIAFSVPTIGNLVVPNAIATAPPLLPLQPMVPVQRQLSTPSALQSTGSGGERPQPPYPKLALEQAQQGTVTLLMRADSAGNLISVEVKESSGSLILDRGATDYVKRHWRLPSGSGAQLFETSNTDRLQAG